MSREQDGAKDISGLSFEQALGELERIVAALERGDVALDDSIRLYERGAALKAHCESKLKDAQLKVEQIVLGPDGPRAEPAKIGG
ncbi:MAG: exodeoxyribonuclease VII small subunit [Caulobacterales bacterium]|jgi:exodeoxyribonuclease VII small subunit